MARPRRTRDLAFGAALWLGALGGVAALAHARADTLGPPAAKIARFLATPTRTLTTSLSGRRLDVGDPVLDPERRYVGRVVRLVGPDGRELRSTLDTIAATATCAVTLAIDPEARVPTPWTARACSAAGDGQWVLDTLLPPAKREVVLAEAQAFVTEHRAEVDAFLRPLAEDAIAHGMGVLEQNLNAALESRKAEIQVLLDDHRTLVKDDLLPVLKRRLGPSAKAKAEPILREVGRKLWDELPMWSLGWSAFVDRIPGTSHARTDEWWAEFLDTKAIPIVAAHEQDLIHALEELIEEGARDPEVRAALGQATRRLSADPRFKALVRGVLEDALVRPFDAAALAQRLASDPGHRARFERLQAELGPALQRVAHRLTVDPATGQIDPDLVRVLRRVVLNKDARWVELGPAALTPGAGR